MVLVGVTGGIGSGKSTVAAALAARGAPVVDADAVARQVVEPGGAAHDALRRRFGGVWRPDGSLDRPALAAVVFADPAALADLNAITHPVIGDELARRLAALAGTGGPVVLDIPLLAPEAVRRHRLDALVVVDTPVEVAVGRLVARRGMAEADARARVAAQGSRGDRLALLELVPHGRVVPNDGDEAALAREVDALWAWLSRLGPGDVAPPR